MNLPVPSINSNKMIMVCTTLLETCGNGHRHCGIHEMQIKRPINVTVSKKVAHFCAINRIVIAIVVRLDLKIPKTVQLAIWVFDALKM